MRLEYLHIKSRFKNLDDLKLDFSDKAGITVLIGNNGSGKSNILEAISSIFAGLYNRSFNPNFDYHLKYFIDNQKIEVVFYHLSADYLFKVNGIEDSIKRQFLPRRVIACYSGEESRLWESYFEPFYKNYIAAIKGAAIPDQPLIFINKYYWDIALLTFHFSDFTVLTELRDFCKQDIGINLVNKISFEFDTGKLKSWKPNPVTNFVSILNPNNDESITISLEGMKSRLGYITNERDFFSYLSAAYMPKDDKLITKIDFNFNNNLTTDCLSEGEKKLILVKLILDVVGDENSLILMDEPDAHIHISRKQNLQQLLSSYTSRENILTTHSPTLTHCFAPDHIIMLDRNNNNDAEVIARDKQEIVHQLTNGIWSYQEQNIFLNSNKDILLVEGKYDKIYISEALKRLKPKFKKYQELDFEYFPMGGADGLENFVDKFTPKNGQKIIAVLDRDIEGKKPIEKVLGKEIDLNFDWEKKNDIYLLMYPKTKNWRTSNFIVEDYFKKATIQKEAIRLIKSADETFKMFPNNVKQNVKENLPKLCQETTFANSEFEGFKALFNKIIEIKRVFNKVSS